MSVMDSLEFAPVLITDAFNLHSGTGSAKSESGAVPYIAASFQNNGVVGYVERAKYPGGWLTLVKDGDGGAGTCFYQPAPFWPSNHVLALEPKDDNATEKGLIAMAAIITHQCFPKYNRGFAANSARLARQKIMAPVIVEGNEQRIDWDGLERLGEELRTSTVERSAQARLLSEQEDDTLPELTFEPMYVIDIPDQQAGIFHAHKGRRLITAHRKRGATPFVAGSRINNSIVDYADVPPLFPRRLAYPDLQRRRRHGAREVPTGSIQRVRRRHRPRTDLSKRN